LGATTVTKTVTISAVAIGLGCCDPTALLVGGTTGADTIRIVPQGAGGAVKVLMNGADLGTYSGFTSIAVFGQSGDDDIGVAPTIVWSACLFGDDGNDRLQAGHGDSVLFGGNGDDMLIGGSGRNLMIGGAGRDRLVAGGDGDILIGGATTYDANAAAICA